MRNVPVMLEGYKLRVVDGPAVKKFEKDGKEVVSVDQQSGATLFVVSVFAKPLPDLQTGRAGKGEEIKVTLETDPGSEVAEGDVVELINPRVSQWEKDGRSGLSWRASGITPVSVGRAAA